MAGGEHTAAAAAAADIDPMPDTVLTTVIPHVMGICLAIVTDPTIEGWERRVGVGVRSETTGEIGIGMDIETEIPEEKRSGSGIEGGVGVGIGIVIGNVHVKGTETAGGNATSMETGTGIETGAMIEIVRGNDTQVVVGVECPSMLFVLDSYTWETRMSLKSLVMRRRYG